MRYIAQWSYWSSLCAKHGTGHLEAGTVLDLEPHVADDFNRDSPGVLVEQKAKPAPAPERKAEPSRDRQVKASGRTRAASKARGWPRWL